MNRFNSQKMKWVSNILTGRYSTIWIATAVLFVISPLIAPGSLDSAPLLSMLPFAAVLAIASAGQTLVVQQRGLDLSVPGMMALGAVLVTALPQYYGWELVPSVVVAIAFPLCTGLINGIVIVYFRVMPIVVTLGMNSVLLGIVFMVSKGTPASAINTLNQFALSQTLGVPNTLLIAIFVVVIGGFIGAKTTIGRRLTAVGISERAAKVDGIPVTAFQILPYAVAGGFYGAAGGLLAAYTKTPPLFIGDSYLLPTVAAVVLGGTALAGGLASIISTGVAAIFLTQLEQLFRSLGWPDAWQFVAQAIVLLLVILIRAVAPGLMFRMRSKRMLESNQEVAIAV